MKKLITGVRDHFNFGKFINQSFVLAMLWFLTTTVYGQINVGLGGVPPITFDATPAITPDQWATLSIGTAAGTLSDGASVRARVQAVAPGSVTTALTTTTTDGTASPARHNTAGGYLVTDPTVNDATLLMATLRNTSGGIINSITVSYDFGVRITSTTETAPGHEALFNLAATSNTWTAIPEFSGLNAAAPVTATLNTAGWAPNTDIYILWADDNGATNPDGAYSIDNFTITAVVPGTISAITITNQPQNLTVTVPQSATFSVGASGAPQFYFWRKNGAFITGATSRTYTIPVTTTADSGTYSVIVSNSLGAVTSANATLTVRADTNGPVLVSAAGNAAGDQVTLTFNEPLDVGTGAENSNYEIFLTAGGGDLLVSLAAITNGSNVVITTDPSTPRNPGENYSIRISNVTDLYGNAIVPNPTTRQISPELLLVAADGTHIWRYDESGTDLTGFQAVNYNDSAWPSAPGTFTQTGGETITLPEFLSPAGGAASQILTPRSAGGPVTVYFRTHFTLPTTPSNAIVSLGYIIDDGAIVYINGAEVHRVRMPAGTVAFNQDASTTSGEPPALVGPITIPTTNLVQGDNVIAVEVHQSGAASSDVVMGLRMTAFVTGFSAVTPPTIDSQPQNVTVNQGLPANFSVGASGTPPLTYQWRKGGAAIAGANSAIYSIPSAQLSDAGTYSVAVSNAQGGVISANATLTVNADTIRPTVVAVSGNLNLTNFTVSFSERVGASASNAANYQVSLAAGGGALTVVSAVVAANGTNVTLTTSGPRTATSEYNITVTGVSDLASNLISPNPTVQSIGSDVVLLAFDATWKYFLGVTNDPSTDLFGKGWEAPGYNDSAWLSGQAGLGVDGSSNGVPIRTALPYMTNGVPIFFRTHFTLSSATGVTLQLRDVVEDGAVYYINGKEAFRHNVNATNVLSFTNLATGQTDPTPIQGPFSLPTTNLVAGDNVLAVVVFQSALTSTDIEMAAELSAHLPGNSGPPPPRINIAYNANNTVTLTWNAAGYRLQEAAALGSSGSTTWSNSTRVSGTAFTPAGTNRFYRLISP